MALEGSSPTAADTLWSDGSGMKVFLYVPEEVPKPGKHKGKKAGQTFMLAFSSRKQRELTRSIFGDSSGGSVRRPRPGVCPLR